MEDNVVISSLEGNRQLLDGGAMFGNAPKAVWQKWCPPDELNRVELACRSLLVQVEGKNILLEAGIGAFFSPKMADRFGVTPIGEHLLLKSLNEHGLDHQDIDYVILSHLHFDHAGGLLPSYDEDPEHRTLLFPNATYVVGKNAWERSIKPHPRDRASFIPELIALLEKSDRLCIIDMEKVDSQPLPELIKKYFSFFESNGHTPGQLHAVVQGNESNVIFCGDLIPGTAWIHLPITMGYDRFPELLIEEKQQTYSQFNLDNTLFFFTHDKDYVCSGVQKNDKGKYQAQNPQKSLNKMEI